MKEPKRYKLNLDSPSTKEPAKIPLKPIFRPSERDEYYDIHSSEKDDTYYSKDLEEFKNKK